MKTRVLIYFFLATALAGGCVETPPESELDKSNNMQANNSETDNILQSNNSQSNNSQPTNNSQSNNNTTPNITPIIGGVEIEPNDTIETATAFEVGDDLVGILDSPDDIDVFVATLRGGTVLEIELAAFDEGSSDSSGERRSIA